MKRIDNILNYQFQIDNISSALPACDDSQAARRLILWRKEGADRSGFTLSDHLKPTTVTEESMFINRKLGHVADFCPICRVPRPFALKRVGSAGHVYYISSGEGELVGYERTCQECGTSLQTEPTTYASICIIIYTTRPHHGRMARMGRMA